MYFKNRIKISIFFDFINRIRCRMLKCYDIDIN